MKISKLSINNFRNLIEINLEPNPKINILLGQNGQGKTNFLEALYASLRGKSFRPYVNRKNWTPITNSSKLTKVDLFLENKNHYQSSLSLQLKDLGLWQIQFNEKKTSPLKLHQILPVVVFSPEDHLIIRGSPEIRRDYIDDIFLDVCPGYSEVLNRFQRALKQRNLILKKTRGDRQLYKNELDSWTKVFVESSLELIELRQEIWPVFVEKYCDVAKKLFSDFCINMELKWQGFSKKDSDLTAQKFVTAVFERLEADLATGWTHVGPHRDDFIIEFDGIDSRSGASQGQARILALLLKWVHAEWLRNERREIPIFLIDDFSSELDARRRNLVLTLLSDLSGQVFITSTEASLVDFQAFSEYTLYDVNEGSINPIKT